MEPYVDIHSHERSSLPLPGRIVFHSYRLGSAEPLPPHPFSAGIHPWDSCKGVDIPALLDYLRCCNADAVGETGLDFSRGHIGANEQESIFRLQLETAFKMRLPVIVHCVRAFEQTMAILKDYTLPGVVFHGYIGSPQQTARVIDAGYYMSAGPTSFRSPKTSASLRLAPLERLFCETDDTGLDIEGVYATASELLETPLPDLKSRIYENFKTLFPWL